MYFFLIHRGGGLPKNYSDEGGGGHAKKIGNWGRSYNFQITNPTSPPYPIKNERSLKGKELRRRSLNSHMCKINKEHASKEVRHF